RGRGRLGAMIELLGDAFSDSRTTTAVLSAVFALGTLVVATYQAKASRISAEAAMLTAKSSGNRAIASMRIKWVEDLRQVLSEYHSILMTVDRKLTDEDRRKLADLGTKLDLMLSLNEEDHKQLWQVADEIYHTEGFEQRNALDTPLMEAGRLDLKNEWEKIKRELRGEDADR